MKANEMVERMKGVAAECEDFDEYTMRLNTHGEDMTFLQLAGWALCGNNTSAITQRTVRDCLESGGYKDGGPREWEDALLLAIREGLDLGLTIETPEDGSDDQFLPFFLTSLQEGIS